MSQKWIPSHTLYECDKCKSEERVSGEGAVSSYYNVDGHDLCPECYEKFKKWVRGAEETG